MLKDFTTAMDSYQLPYNRKIDHAYTHKDDALSILRRFCFGHSITGLTLCSPSQLSTTNFSLHEYIKTKYLVMRKSEMIKQSKLLKIILKIKI